MPTLPFTARWAPLDDWVQPTYADPTSLTSAVYLVCVVFFLSFLLLARRERL